MAVVTVAFYSVKNMINVFAALFSIGLLFCTTVILALVFVPLVSQVDVHGEVVGGGGMCTLIIMSGKE